MPLVFMNWESLENNHRQLFNALGSLFFAELKWTAERLAQKAKELNSGTCLCVIPKDGEPSIVYGMANKLPARLSRIEAFRVIFQPSGEISIDIQPILMPQNRSMANHTPNIPRFTSKRKRT